jgi:metallo-beta-lactamase class B
MGPATRLFAAGFSRRRPVFAGILLAFATLLSPPEAVGQAAPGAARLEQHSPMSFKVFDNLYYVGTDWVSAFLIPTDDGLILIDALYGEHVETMIQAIRRLGFDPEDIRYVFVTHAHYDHAGGARMMQQRYGATVGMSAADWAITGVSSQEGPAFAPPDRDLVIDDGQEIRLGGQLIRFFVTPGHTPGSLSLQFDVLDRDSAFTAVMFGGAGLNIDETERIEAYIRSVERLLSLEGLEVNIPNHPMMGGFQSRAAQLDARRPGDTHPLVAPHDLRAWLERLLTLAREKLAQQRRDTR